MTCANPLCSRECESDLCETCRDVQAMAEWDESEVAEAERLNDIAKDHGLDEWQAARGL